MSFEVPSNIDSVGFCYLKHLGAKITKESFVESIKEEPTFPSLFSLSRAMDKFKVLNNSYKIETENLEDIPLPFIAYIRKKPTGKDFVFVSDLNNTSVKYRETETSITKKPISEFKADFLNIIFKAELTPCSGESKFEEKTRQNTLNKTKTGFSYGFLIISIILLIFKSEFTSFKIDLNFVFNLLAIAGFSIIILLLTYEIDNTNKFLRNICSTNNSSKNCSAVLNSKAARIFGVSWSHIGFILFSFLILCSIAFATTPSLKLSAFSLIFMLCLPYVPYSIYTQYKLIKQWCPLCLSVQIIIVIGFYLGLRYLNEIHFIFPKMSMWSFATIFICFMLPTTSIFLFKPILIKARSKANLQIKYKQLLNDPELFWALLKQQSKAPDDWENLGINLGNITASTTIIKVCNPYCGPCAIMHSTLDEIIDNNKNVKLKIIFTSTDDDVNIKTKTVKHLMAVAATSNVGLIKTLLDTWYLNQDYQSLVNNFPIQKTPENLDEKVREMRDWCKSAGITHTPTIYVNGWQLPEVYDVIQLKYML